MAASYLWNRGATDPSLGAWIMVSVVAGLVVALVTAFKQTWAPYTTPVYAALEGVALGGISVVFEAGYSGIVGPGSVPHLWDAGRAARGLSLRPDPRHGEL